MIEPLDAARVLARGRNGALAVPHPALEAFWGLASGAPELDFPPPQTDGEAAAFALGLALSRPEERFLVLDTDEGLLASLGTLVTIADAAPRNLVHVVFESGARNGPAALPLPGAGRTDFAVLARGAGYRSAHRLEDLETLATEAVRSLAAPGPAMMVIPVRPVVREAYPRAAPRYDMTADVRRYRRRLERRPGN